MQDKLFPKPDLDLLFEDLTHPNPNINKKAFIAMAHYWPEHALPRLIDNLDDPNIHFRRVIIKAIGIFGKDALAPLVREYQLANNRTMRTSCMKAFVQVAVNLEGEKFPDEVMDLIESAIHDDTPEIVLTVISLLKLLGNQGVPLLLAICREDKNVLRIAAAVTALGEMNNEYILECFKDLLADEFTDPLVRDSVKESIRTYQERNS